MNRPLALEALDKDLIARWEAAFHRRAELTSATADALNTVYAKYPAFQLEKYSAKKFKPGARITKKPSATGDDYVFDLDAEGRPVRVRFSHTINGVDWEGGYLYSPDEVEHIEYCKQTGVPSLYSRLTLSESAVVTEQRFVCNSGGSSKLFAKGTPKEKVQRILEDAYSHFRYVTRFQIENGVTVSAEELHVTAQGVHKPTREYIYEKGSLMRIVQHWPDGEKMTLFAARRKKAKK